jgi:hypothetical protein
MQERRIKRELTGMKERERQIEYIETKKIERH